MPNTTCETSDPCKRNTGLSNDTRWKDLDPSACCNSCTKHMCRVSALKAAALQMVPACHDICAAHVREYIHTSVGPSAWRTDNDIRPGGRHTLHRQPDEEDEEEEEEGPSGIVAVTRSSPFTRFQFLRGYECT